MSDEPVLLLGESGTGKGLVAKVIHECSGRKDALFEYRNVGGLDDETAHSELFGHVKGSFTNAYSDRAGAFELANKGTFFLDEIGDASLPVQVKLLSAIGRPPNQIIQRLGAKQSIAVDTRVIAATDRDLSQHIADGRFREALYRRIETLPLTMPPLRERTEDIPLLAQSFLNDKSQTAKKSIRRFTPDAMAALCKHHWPGNVRQLETVIARSVVLSDSSEIDATLVNQAFALEAKENQDSPQSRAAAANILVKGPVPVVVHADLTPYLRGVRAVVEVTGEILGTELADKPLAYAAALEVQDRCLQHVSAALKTQFDIVAHRTATGRLLEQFVEERPPLNEILFHDLWTAAINSRRGAPLPTKPSKGSAVVRLRSGLLRSAEWRRKRKAREADWQGIRMRRSGRYGAPGISDAVFELYAHKLDGRAYGGQPIGRLVDEKQDLASWMEKNREALQEIRARANAVKTAVIEAGTPATARRNLDLVLHPLDSWKDKRLLYEMPDEENDFTARFLAVWVVQEIQGTANGGARWRGKDWDNVWRYILWDFETMSAFGSLPCACTSSTRGNRTMRLSELVQEARKPEKPLASRTNPQSSTDS
jgi:hypothetical protein